MGDLGIDGRVALKWSLKKEGVMIRTEFSWLRIRSNGRLL